MNRQSVTKAQKPKYSTFLPPTDILQRKTINRTNFEASTVEARSLSGQHIDKHGLPGAETHFSYDFSRIPVTVNSPYPIQAKLRIGQPNDMYEQEADRVADMVMRMCESDIHLKPTSSFARDSSCGNRDKEEAVQTKVFPAVSDRYIKYLVPRFASGEVPNCGNESYGECECDFDENGIPTGKTYVSITDTDPCTGPCVILHEHTHVKDIEPICREYKSCHDRAGDDEDAQWRCANKAADRLIFIHKYSECNAYIKSLECLRKQLSKPECKSEEQQRRLRERITTEWCYLKFYCFKSVKEIATKTWDYLKRIFGSFIEKFRSILFGGK